MKKFSEDKLTIRVRAKGQNVETLRALPLHPSQCEVETIDKYSDFELVVVPTPELYGRLLSYGNGVEVLEPKEVRLEMRNSIMNMSFIYSEEMARTKIGKAVIYATNKFPKANIARVRHSLEMQRGIDYIRRLDACMLYLEATQGWEYIKNFRLNDIDTLAIFQRGDTEGVYMCSSEGVRAKLREAEIGSIDDIVEVYRNHHHPKMQPWPYDHSLVQALISYFSVYVKCHYSKEYDIFMAGLLEN
jgi:hypothetical protein